MRGKSTLRELGIPLLIIGFGLGLALAQEQIQLKGSGLESLSSKLGFVPTGQQGNKGPLYTLQGRDAVAHFYRDRVVFAMFGYSEGAPGTWQRFRGQDREHKDLEVGTITLRFLGASPKTEVVPKDPSSVPINRLIGNDPAHWRSGLSSCNRLVYSGLWPGVDLQISRETPGLKFDFVVQPGGRSERIRLRYEGADSIDLDEGGNLIAENRFGRLVDHAPVAYQEIEGQRIPIEAGFLSTRVGDGGYEIGFVVNGAYDPNRTLIIDPSLFYSSYMGGGRGEYGNAITVDSAGNAYIVGLTTSSDFLSLSGNPVSGYDTTYNAQWDDRRSRTQLGLPLFSPPNSLLILTYLPLQWFWLQGKQSRSQKLESAAPVWV